MNKIGFYLRSAVGDDDEIKNQREALESYVQKMAALRPDWGNIAKVFIDSPASGLSLTSPRLQPLLRAGESGEIDVVMVSNLARISRSPTASLEALARLRGAGCNVFSLDQMSFV